MFNPEIGNAVPFSVYHGFDRRYGFCPKLKLRTVNKIAEKCIPLWQRVIDGAEEAWNGNNNVLVLNEDAQAAEKQIRDIILYFESQN